MTGAGLMRLRLCRLSPDFVAMGRSDIGWCILSNNEVLFLGDERIVTILKQMLEGVGQDLFTYGDTWVALLVRWLPSAQVVIPGS